MKKSARRLFSAFLALVLILSVMPLAAFASVAEDHPDGCCQGSAYAIFPCNHIYQTYDSTTYVYYDNDYHLTTTRITQTCTLCGYFQTISEDVARHGHTVNVWTLIPNTTNEYEGKCEYCDGVVTRTITNGMS